MANVYGAWPPEWVASHGRMQAGHVVGHPADPNSIELAVEGFAYCAVLLPRIWITEENQGPLRVSVRKNGGLQSDAHNPGLLNIHSVFTFHTGQTVSSELWVERGASTTPADHARLKRDLDGVKAQLTERLGSRISVKFPRGQYGQFPVIFSRGKTRAFAIVPQATPTKALS